MRKDLSIITNNKSHTDFSLISKSVTLNDLERRTDRSRVLSLW